MKSLARQAARSRPRCPLHSQAPAFTASTSLRCGAHTITQSKKLTPRVEKKQEFWKAQMSKFDAKLAARSRVDTVSKGHDPPTRLRLDDGAQRKGRHSVFRSTVLHRFNGVLTDLSSSSLNSGGIDQDELNRQAGHFMNHIDEAFQLAERNITDRNRNALFWNLREAFILKDLKGLSTEIQYSFQSFLMNQRTTKEIEMSHQRLLDFRFPHEWFPATRTMQRTIHAHVGPTNSGKTYNAIKALENSKRGVYAGPLRLLANEVYQRLNSKGFPCALLTGEEVRIPEDTDQYFTSCTVEMTPFNQEFDVAVIDEIQMIADPHRGMAWTSAVLGVQAKEVHVCGEERTVGIIQALCASTGDKCVVHRYERLSPLETMDKSINGDYRKLQKGDAVVAFNRLTLHALKRTIEKETGKRCAIVYGSLPPEVRVQQAALFNDPDNDYDFIVASDAIGMGLNLEIRRVILESVAKYDGTQNRLLFPPEIKQIGGRAGRYRTARTETAVPAEEEAGKVGYVTTMDFDDLKVVKRAFERQVYDIQRAVIHPPAGVVENFASYFPPDTPLSFILMRIKATATLNKLYEMHIPPSQLELADLIQDLPLHIYDRLTLCNLPVTLRAEGAIEVLRSLANVIATNSRGDLLDIKEIPLEILDHDPSKYKKEADYLHRLEFLHTSVNMYLWLSYRYTGMFRDQELAFHVRTLVQEKLIQTLDKLDFTEQDLRQRRRSRRRDAETRRMQRAAMGEGELENLEEETDTPPIDDAAPAQEPERKAPISPEAGEVSKEWREAGRVASSPSS
ncbi:ATP-dependent RNA helicase suv3 [Paramyrothecium foliicola]|nr:ATP-dependent RNA helicase suv3 [Paramyrothecium foliicola]